MWDPPRPGLEPVSPALAGGLSTTAPPGKPKNLFLKAGISLLVPLLESLNLAVHRNGPAGWFKSAGSGANPAFHPALSPTSCVVLDKLPTSLNQVPFVLDWAKNIHLL